MKVMAIVKATPDSEAGVLPDTELLDAMGRFNQQMAEAGLIIEAAGLKPSSAGVRVQFSGDRRTVIDGPFTETKELIAGFWILNVASLQEAIDWMKRCPSPHPGVETAIEIRPFYELEDFAENLPQGLTPEQQLGRYGETWKD